MRILLDEMFSHATVAALAAQGIEATHVRERGLAATDDDRILEFACAEGWILVTANLRDFRPLHAERIAAGAAVTPILLLTQATLDEFGPAHAEMAATLIAEWVQADAAPYAGEHWLGAPTA